MTDELWDIFGGVNEKQADSSHGVIGNTTNLPQNWTNVFGQDGAWETISFQRNIDTTPYANALRRDAVGLSLAIQCADVKAQDIAKAEMRLWRRKGREWVEVEPNQHWLAGLLATAPNDLGHSWTEFWRMVVLYLDLTQNGYVLKEINRLGDVVGLIPLPTQRVRPRVSTDGDLFYEIWASSEYDRARLGDDYIIVPANRMIHFRGRMLDGLTGLSNVTLGNPVFGLLGAISDFQTKLFQNDGRQPIVFESKEGVFGTGDQADAAFRRLKEQLREAVKRMHAYGDPILLEHGYQAKVVAQNSRDAMTTDAYNQQVLRVCGLMRMPPHKIFALSEIAYNNMASLNAVYANDILVPIAKNIGEKLRNSLLPREDWANLDPAFDQMALLAGDPATLMDLLDKGLKIGVVKINEARERLPLALSPLKGGDVRFVPVNMAMVDDDGEVVQQAATGQPNNTGEAPPKPAEAPTPQEQQRALTLAVKAGVEAATLKADPASGRTVTDALREMGMGLVEAVKAAPSPHITVPVSVVMPKKGKEETTVLEHDEKGRIRRFVKEEIEG